MSDSLAELDLASQSTVVGNLSGDTTILNCQTCDATKPMPDTHTDQKWVT